jgi:AmmeMemoRadiSam system protein B
MIRKPVVAGQFYPDDPQELDSLVEEYLDQADLDEKQPTLLAMVPHAGYPFSGPLCGQTIGEAKLPGTIVCLGPKHTSLGESMAVWPEGGWKLPGGGLKVDAELAAAIIDNDPDMYADTEAHAREHSIEVVLPFLRAKFGGTRIVPIAVGDANPGKLVASGRMLGEVLENHSENVAIVVSSDMSHYLAHEHAMRRDALAIEPILQRDPQALFESVHANRISMCGYMPMTMGLAAANAMGATKARLVGYTTSGEVTGDYTNVVAYAGFIVR